MKDERTEGRAGTVAAVMRRINAEGWRQRKHFRDRWIAFAEAGYAENGNVGLVFMLPGDSEYSKRVLHDKVKAVLRPGGSLKKTPEACRLVNAVTDGLLTEADKAARLRKKNAVLALTVTVSEEFVARHLGGGGHED